MAIYCPDSSIILTIDGIEEEHPANTDLVIVEKKQVYNFFYGANNYVGEWTPTQFSNHLNLGIRGVRGERSSGARLTLAQLLSLVTFDDKLFIINNYAPNASVTMSIEYTYNPGNGVPTHTAMRVYINGTDIWGYTAGFLYWGIAPISIQFWEIFINGFFYRRTLNPVIHRCTCPAGTEWDEECLDCVCTIICDGTIASIIRSIVL